MSEIQHRDIQSNGITLRIAEAGEGPLVLLNPARRRHSESRRRRKYPKTTPDPVRRALPVGSNTHCAGVTSTMARREGFEPPTLRFEAWPKPKK